MYCIIDDKNTTLPRHITEEQYLALPLATQVLYQLQYEDDNRNFIAADGEPANDRSNVDSTYDMSDIEGPVCQDEDEDQMFP